MPSVVDQYRRLLTAEESLATLDAVLALLDRALSSKPKRGRRSQADMPRGLLKSQKDFLHDREAQRRLSSPRFRRVYWSMAKLPDLLRQESERIAESQYSLLMDLLLLVFHHTYFAILPRLENHDTIPVYSALLDAMRQFAHQFPSEPDRFQLSGLIHAESGDARKAVEAFRAAIAATHADEHDFMSRVQTLWTFLLEKGLHREALLLLLDVYPRVSRSDLDEMRTLLMETFSASTRGRSSA